jgi:hypothetical protein
MESLPRSYKEKEQLRSQTNSIKVFRGFLGPRANAELVPKFHIALHASHAALPMVIMEISHCTSVTSKYGDLALQVCGVSDETVK